MYTKYLKSQKKEKNDTVYEYRDTQEKQQQNKRSYDQWKQAK
jgi:hypothetical protein